MNDIAIKVENLNKVYKLYDKPIDRMKEALSLSKKKYSRDHYALKDISFEIKKGETIGIIGVNGSGKSTLLKIITGVLTQTTGYVQVNGKISALLELGAGFNPEYTGLENIYLNGTMMGYSKEDMDDRVQPIVEFADIGEFINQPVKTYSSGMFARLAFAVAINVEPDILIVDEALSVGDVFFQLKCFKKFDEFRQKKKTILFVSHDLSSIIKYCSKCIMLKKGFLLDFDNTKKVVDLYKKDISYSNNQVTLTEKIEKFNYKLWKDNIVTNKDFIEYGNKRIEIIDYGIFNDKNVLTNSIEKGSYFSIKMLLKFNETIENPIVAFSIKDINGFEVTGTNTFLEKINIGVFEQNNVVEINFSQVLNLQNYTFFLSLGCTNFSGSGELEVYHRLYDILQINIISQKNSNGYFDMNSQFICKIKKVI